jgi:hypothetical protein
MKLRLPSFEGVEGCLWHAYPRGVEDLRTCRVVLYIAFAAMVRQRKESHNTGRDVQYFVSAWQKSWGEGR